MHETDSYLGALRRDDGASSPIGRSMRHGPRVRHRDPAAPSRPRHRPQRRAAPKVRVELRRLDIECA